MNDLLECFYFIIDQLLMFHQTSKTWYQKLLQEYQLEKCQHKETLSEIVLTLFQVLDRPVTLSKYLKDIEIYCDFVRIKILCKQPFAGLCFGILLHSLLIRVQQQVKFDIGNRLKILEFVERCLAEINLIDRNIRQVKKVNVTFFHQNVLFPYYFYFKKKIQYLELKLLSQSQKEIIQIKKQQTFSVKKINLLLFKEKQILQTQQTQAQLQGHYEQCYKIINLLNIGLKITSSFLTMLRYYHSQRQSLSHLNRILASDFSKIYNRLSNSVKLIKKIEQQLEIQSLQYCQLMKQIEKINQKMYIIFLNRYNGYQLISSAPSWIPVELKYSNIKHSQSLKKDEKGLNSQLLSMASCRSIQDQQPFPKRSRSKSAITYTQEKYEEKLQIQTRSTIICNCENSQAEKQKQRLSILSELQSNFKKYYNKEQPSNLKQKGRFKKNKSFYQAKISQKLNL